MPIDDRTPNRSYQLPNTGNLLLEDVARLRAALNAIDADVFARYTKTEVDTLINGLIAGAPGALNTLDELAAALGDDANFAATVTNLLALKANSTDVYSKAEADARYVQGQVQTEMVFVATANQSVFTLSTAVINKPSALVTVDGVVQPTSEYSLNQAGTTLTLSEGVPVGTVVRVLAMGVASAGAPADDSVTTPKLRNGAVTAEKLAPNVGGKILQVVQTTKLNGFSTTSTSPTDIDGLSVTITPLFVTSKILVMVDVKVSHNQGGYGGLLLLRGATAIYSVDSGINQYSHFSNGTDDNWLGASSVSMNYLDSPASTSALTYKLQAFSNGSPYIFSISRVGIGGILLPSSITVMEVAA